MTVQEMLDREAIRLTLATYNQAGDSGRLDDFASVFTEDAVLKIPGTTYEGKENIAKGLFSDVGSVMGTGDEPAIKFIRHNITTSKITFNNASSAYGKTYFVVITDLGLDHAGFYKDEFRKVGDEWKISSRDVRLDYMNENSAFPSDAGL